MKVKKLRDYLGEFLLIFLAVMAGAITENYREDYIERKEVRDYARSLVNDLRLDTAEIRNTRTDKLWLAGIYDSAMQIIESGNVERHPGYLYYAARYLTLNNIFNCQDVTFLQLQGSGNFRYFENEKIYRQISDYYKLNKRYASLEGPFGYTDVDEIASITIRLFDQQALHSLDRADKEVVFSRVVNLQGELPALKNDKQALDLFYAALAQARHRSYASANFLLLLNNQALQLIQTLNRNFDLVKFLN
ncbi:MAG: hypothetical protein ACKOAR_05960 [Bacteroidota bacterium]